MTSIVTDFKSINRILTRQEQKAEFVAKNPEPVNFGLSGICTRTVVWDIGSPGVAPNLIPALSD